MNRHQVLTGAANAGDSCYAVGSVEGTHFTAYGTGTTVVILASDFQRVQVIPNPLNESHLEVSGITCCSDLGKIAASYGSTVCIFEPMPLSNHSSSHRLDYHWYHVGTLAIEGDVLALKWSLDGSRLLLSGDALEMWQCLEVSVAAGDRRPSFFIEDDGRHPSADRPEWACVWRSTLANPVTMIKFSSDGLLFATAGDNDRLVKVWYEDRKELWNSESCDVMKNAALNFNFVYLTHPRAVTGFNWRRTSKYMHRNTVANMLLTSCKDNICRIWCETVVPEDGLLDTQQLEPKDEGSPLVTHRNKKRIIQRFHQIRHAFQKRKKSSMSQAQQHSGNSMLVGTLTLPDVQRIGGGNHGHGLVPSFHFHLAASINLNSDVPLIGSLGNVKNETFNFVIHWLDNKEFHTTLEAERLIDELSHRPMTVLEQTNLEPQSNGVGSSARHKERRVGLPTITSDPSIAENAKRFSTPLQKTKSYITMFSGRWSTLSVEPTPETSDVSSKPEAFEQFEQKVEHLVQSWHQGSDMLYGIHPLDGSLVMWVVDNLDESSLGTFNQVKVSLSAMLPSAFPVFDAITMQPNLWLFDEYGRLGLKSLKLESDAMGPPPAPQRSRYTAIAAGMESSGRSDNSLMPNVLMVTKHTNGSINMWQISFAENSQFSTVVNVSHVSRASGHRFRANSSACHPLLPLLLTTAHNKFAQKTRTPAESNNGSALDSSSDSDRAGPSVVSESCSSELILWRVAPIGPLSKSGGITELAKINSSVPLAFSKVAWFPTLLPVSCLGMVSNSPSALFVASDGVGLRIYQAVLDGRLILAEQQTRRRKPTLLRSFSNDSAQSDDFPATEWVPRDASLTWNVVSLQSTSRPGCIISLKPIDCVIENWQNVQLLHVFQELLISGRKAKQRKQDAGSATSSTNESTIKGSFQERFYLVIVEKMDDGSSVVHMWLIAVSSRDSNQYRGSSTCSDQASNQKGSDAEAKLPFAIAVTKICSQGLPLPNGISVTTTAVAAGHLSSSSIYPACFAPYLLSTACTDGRVRLWQCVSSEDQDTGRVAYQWKEWKMMSTGQGASDIEVEGKILSVSSAYSGRIAVAHQLLDRNNSTSFNHVSLPSAGIPLISKQQSYESFGLHVSVYECESSGGSRWILEDMIEVPCIVLSDPKVDLDLSLIFDNNETNHGEVNPPRNSTPAFRLPSVPSASTVLSIRRYLSQQECHHLPVRLRPYLDWVSTEDGSHILTVSIGSRILLYSATSVESCPFARWKNALWKSGHVDKGYTMTVSSSEVRWVLLRTVELQTADGYPPLPKHLTWVRNGILVVGLENEMHVYSQWKFSEDDDNENTISEAGHSSVANVPAGRCRAISKTMSGIKLNASIANLALLATKRAQRTSSAAVLRAKMPKIQCGYLTNTFNECGLFEAAQITNPCIPQYHPKQLLELLLSGHMFCVRLILSHLLRCLSVRPPENHEAVLSETDASGKSPPLEDTEEPVNVLEVTSIPPLPLYILLYADGRNTRSMHSHRNGGTTDAAKTRNYDRLFSTEKFETASVSTNDDGIKDLFDSSFGPEQAQLLAKHLEHTDLPGLSCLDQINLVALTESLMKLTSDDDSGNQNGRKKLTDIVDDCGLRFLFAALQHSSLVATLPSSHCEAFRKLGLSSEFYIWAFHSKNKLELLDALPWKQKDEVTWDELKQFGVGWWLQDSELLTHWIEKVAKTTFQATKDPVDVALYYIALRKKNVLSHLFRIQNDDAKCQFFKNDFSEDRWRKAALKNAFRLLGKQQFHKTAAFFLLAGAVSDAIKVCLMQMKDLQLALVILRLYEGCPLDGINPSCKRLLYDEILGCDENGLNGDSSRASRDPFLRSMAYWMLSDYKAAFDTLLVSDNRTVLHEEGTPWKAFAGPRTSIFNVYRYLRTHPKVIEKKFPQTKGFSGRDRIRVGATHAIGPEERQLYFRTAHSYFQAGCPLLSIEALMDMPPVIETKQSESPSDGFTAQPGDTSRATNGSATQNSTSTVPAHADSLDWSQPVTRFDDDDKLDLSFGLSSSDEDDEPVKQNEVEEEPEQSTLVEHVEGVDTVDVMAQQLNFIACMKILVNELSTLATGFEVDGGQLRYQLYLWLEKEMEVLKTLCSTECEEDDVSCDALSDDEEEEVTEFRRRYSSRTSRTGRKLHETMLAEKFDFEAKMRRLARRKKWLKANEQVLSTLLSYSILHGSSASGLASMQMELLLLLQELQQTKTPQKLRSPIPFPTSLPLLSASIASAKTVVSDPIRHLQSMYQDLLHTLIEFKSTPAVDAVSSKVYLLRDLSIALSACIYQCLCDSDSFVVAEMPEDVGLMGFTSIDVVYKDSFLMAGARKKESADSVPIQLPTSQPSMWPGVSSLVTLLNQKRDEDSPKLNILLLESLVAVSVSLLCYALAVYDAIVLYRLVAHPLDERIWPLLFGGGRKKPIQISVSSDARPPKSDPSDYIRERLTRQVIGTAPNVSTKDGRSFYEEQFVSPQTNMIAYFLAKVDKMEDPGVDYDSGDSVTSGEDDEEDFDDSVLDGNDETLDAAIHEESKDDFKDDGVFQTPDSNLRRGADRLREHIDPHSYSWCLMRYAIIKHTNQSFRTFLPNIGMDLSDLPMRSPLVHSIVKNLEIWEEQLRAQMDAFPGPPNGYIPGCSVDSSLGVNIVKYSALTNPSHTPFLSTHYSALPAKRLWHFLVTRDNLHDVFIRYVFGKGQDFNDLNSSKPFYAQGSEDAKIIYRDQETISSFSLIPSNKDCLIVATSKELVEMNVSALLHLPSSSRNSRLCDIEVIRNSNDVVHDFDNGHLSKTVRHMSVGATMPQNSVMPGSSPGADGIASSESMGSGGHVLLRRLESGIRKVAGHPLLPYYMTGSHDGVLKLWELGRDEPVAEPRRASTPFPKPTKVLFNSHGNKFGVGDADGKVSLWQLSHNLSPGLPFLELKCHSKCVNDFVFVGSSSLLATAGVSSDNFSVCLWDTLLPKSKSLIKGFQCSSDGCCALAYAPYHQAIISGGKKGELYIFDVRQRQLRHTFLAHNSAVKCIAFDPVEDCFATGSADGEIKVWDLTVHNLLYSFPSDRSKATRFRSSGVAVTELYLGAGAQLFSSSAEGTLKFRHLALKHSTALSCQNDDRGNSFTQF